jgi:hypothetical protein
VGEHQRRGASQHAACGGGDRGSGSGDDLGGHRGRDVATDAGEIIELVPEVQKKLFHGVGLYGSGTRAGVRALTIAAPLRPLAGATRRA